MDTWRRQHRERACNRFQAGISSKLNLTRTTSSLWPQHISCLHCLLVEENNKKSPKLCTFPTLLPRPFRHSNCRELKALGVAKSVDDKYRSAVTRGSWVARKRGQGSGLKDLSTYRLLKGPSAGHPDSFPTPSTPATTDCVNTLQ